MRIVNATWLLIAGISVGWLAGLSVSPVLSTVLTSLLAAVGGAVSGLQTVRKGGGQPELTSAAPVAILLLGVAMAAPAGVLVRTHGLLEPDGQPPAQAAAPLPKQASSSARVGGLFNAPEQSQHWCGEVLRASDQRLASTLRRASDESRWVVELTDTVESPEDLRRIVEAMCAGH